MKMQTSFALVVALALSAAAAAQGSGRHQTSLDAAVGVDLAFVSDPRKEDGIGIGGHLEWEIGDRVGPGHFAVGVTALVAFADDERSHCKRMKSVMTGAGRVRYVVGRSSVVKPYAGVGLGFHSISRDQQSCDPRPREGDDDLAVELGTGLPLIVGVDFARDRMDVGAFASVYASEPDARFGLVGVGIRCPF